MNRRFWILAVTCAALALGTFTTEEAQACGRRCGRCWGGGWGGCGWGGCGGYAWGGCGWGGCYRSYGYGGCGVCSTGYYGSYYAGARPTYGSPYGMGYAYGSPAYGMGSYSTPTYYSWPAMTQVAAPGETYYRFTNSDYAPARSIGSSSVISDNSASSSSFTQRYGSTSNAGYGMGYGYRYGSTTSVGYRYTPNVGTPNYSSYGLGSYAMGR